MADDCSRSSRFARLTPAQYAKTVLGGCLIDAVDSARNVATVLGARPYQVHLVHTRWTGGVRGDGVEEVISRIAVLPTPLVASLDSLTKNLQPVGLDEVGTLRVSEISASYTEAQLMGQGPGETPIPEDQSFWWEVTFPHCTGTEVTRRFFPRATPNYNADSMEWVILLLRTSQDRAPNGDPR